MARQHVLRDITTENLDPKVKYSNTHRGKLAEKNVSPVDAAEKPAVVETTPEKTVAEKPVAKKPVAKAPAAKAPNAEEPAKPAPKADEKTETEEEKKDA